MAYLVTFCILSFLRVCYPLLLLFRKSHDIGVFFKYHEINSVIPIFKTSDIWPISILSYIGKLFEVLGSSDI